MVLHCQILGHIKFQLIFNFIRTITIDGWANVFGTLVYTQSRMNFWHNTRIDDSSYERQQGEKTRINLVIILGTLELIWLRLSFWTQINWRILCWKKLKQAENFADQIEENTPIAFMDEVQTKKRTTKSLDRKVIDRRCKSMNTRSVGLSFSQYNCKFIENILMAHYIQTHIYTYLLGVHITLWASLCWKLRALKTACKFETKNNNNNILRIYMYPCIPLCRISSCWEFEFLVRHIQLISTSNTFTVNVLSILCKRRKKNEREKSGAVINRVLYIGTVNFIE